MEKIHIKFTNLLAVIFKLKLLVACEAANHYRLDIFSLKDSIDLLKVFRLNCYNHSFLSFTDPNLSIAKARIF